jgi:hypothetical protein
VASPQRSMGDPGRRSKQLEGPRQDGSLDDCCGLGWLLRDMGSREASHGQSWRSKDDPEQG